MRSLAEDIRSRSEEELAELLRRRPDLTRPAPADLTALAARAATVASTTRAVDHLDATHLAVLEAAALLDGSPRAALDGVAEPVPEGLAELTGLDGPGLAEPVLALRDAALLWRAPDGLAPTRTVLDVLGPAPAGLGPRAADLRLPLVDPDDVDRLREEAPPAARTVLDRLVDGGPVATVSSDSQAATAARWLGEHGLAAVREDADDTARLRVTLPREVALHLRGGTTRRRPDLTVPAESGPAPDVDTQTAAVVLDLVALLDEVLEHLESARPRVLRSGGMAVVDLRALARQTQLDPDDLRFLLDLALGARLLADDEGAEPTWRLTTLVEIWREASTAQRWVDLVVPWTTSLRTTLQIGESAPRALSDDMVWPPIRGLRADVLDVLAQGVPAAEVTTALRERRPRRMPQDAQAVVGSVLTEAERLGVTVQGRIGAAATAVVRGASPQAVEILQGDLPEPVDHALVQADLTAVVPGPPSPSLATTLRRSATLESRGGASIYRFSDASVRQALDAGLDGEQLLAELAAISRTPLPQGLEYLVRDVARRHGQLRAGSVGSYLRSDDEAHLDRLLALRDLSHLQLRRLAPTVLVSPASAPVLLESLREVGASPVRESSGGVVTAAGAVRRVSPPREVPPPVTVAADPPALVAAMRRGEQAAQARALVSPTGPPLPPMDPAGVAGVLREAAADRVHVWLGVADAIGDVRRVLLLPEAVEGGRVRGSVEDEQRTYSIHRITGVAVAG